MDRLTAAMALILIADSAQAQVDEYGRMSRPEAEIYNRIHGNEPRQQINRALYGNNPRHQINQGVYGDNYNPAIQEPVQQPESHPQNMGSECYGCVEVWD